ncbi:MAG: N-acetylglucosamine-6-phosphate deacetylase [Micrococcaceae bacterium]
MNSLQGTIITDGKVLKDYVITWNHDTITELVPAQEFNGTSQRVTGYIVPGFIDIHNHGGAGGDFPSGNEEACRKAIDYHHKNGTTSLQASTVTADPETLCETTKTLAKLCAEGLIEGVHLEGPFVSKDKCGAQDPQYIIDPDITLTNQIIEAANGYLNTMTYAPERPGADKLVAHLIKNGVTPSLGHTSCDIDQAKESFDIAQEAYNGAGVPTTTHTFNAMPPLNHRDPGPIAPALERARKGEVILEVIGDGTHLHPNLVSMIFTVVGANNIALITDAMAAAGLEDGEYMLGPQEVIVSDGVARLKRDGAIAGGTSNLHKQLKLGVQQANIDLVDMITALTSTPAKVISQSRHLDKPIGTLDKGAYADIVVLDQDLELKHVIRRGEKIA